jgi:hypothetical protein
MLKIISNLLARFLVYNAISYILQDVVKYVSRIYSTETCIIGGGPFVVYVKSS